MAYRDDELARRTRMQALERRVETLAAELARSERENHGLRQRLSELEAELARATPRPRHRTAPFGLQDDELLEAERTGQWHRLLLLLERRAQADDVDVAVRALLRMGEIALTRLHAPALATTHFASALRARDHDRDALAGLARSLCASGALGQAVDVLHRLAELAETPEQKATHLRHAADLCRQLGDRGRARQIDDRAVAIGGGAP